MQSQDNNQLKIADNKNLLILFESTTKLARTGSDGEQNQGHSTGEVCWKYFCVLLWFLFYESKMDQN